ncbi:MAG: DUF4202 domain-containing protein [Nitrospinae bacterium]|nr:DUF4202 domain-containing protein [Nitrospinota bacterium]
MCENPTRFENAICLIDEANSLDPNTEIFEGEDYPKELLYSVRMTKWLETIEPLASEALRLAVRSQHIRRWEIPRSDYPLGRKGYHRWRTRLYDYHGEKTAEILEEAGYDEETIVRVRKLLKKQGLKSNPETQTLEDVACLVFLESYFWDFSRLHDEEKIIGILRKTWAKMSARGQEAARELSLNAGAEALLNKALAPEN